MAVDHPFVQAQTLEALLELDGDTVVPVDAGWQQVTCAVYRPSFLAAASRALDDGGRSIIAALDLVETRLVDEKQRRSWGEDGRSWFSVDSLDRLAEGIEKLG